MKKKMLLTAGLLFALFTQNSLFAQDANSFADVKGMNVVNAGVGLGTYGLSGTGGLPLTASFEHGFTKNISAGLGFGFIQKKYAHDWKYTYLLIGARGSYHLNEALNVANPKLDIYGGAGLIYRRFSFDYSFEGSDELGYDYDASGGDLQIELHAGGRYMFNKGVGAFAEVGYGISPLQVGVTLKF